MQLRLYESALRTYDKEQTYITDDMLAMMAEWMAWNVYPVQATSAIRTTTSSTTSTAEPMRTTIVPGSTTTSSGNYTYLFIEDMAGIQPRADEKIELSPIDFSL